MSDDTTEITQPNGRTYYDVLGVPASADRDALRTAYRTRLDALQVDAWKGVEADRRAEAARVNDAWNVLSDPFQRDRYDAQVEDGTVTRLPDAPSATPKARANGRTPLLNNPFEVGSGPVPPDYRAVLANRINALFLDIMACFAAYFASGVAIAWIVGPRPKGSSVPLWVHPTLAGITTAVLILWFVFPTARTGQTVGQRWFGIRVVRSESGELPGLTRSLFRYGPLIVLVIAAEVIPWPLLHLIAFAVGMTFIVTKAKRGIPDMAARTTVVDAVPRPPRLRRRKATTR
ncbi:MAG: RDD family protein [Acidimicrobiia bacterium]